MPKRQTSLSCVWVDIQGNSTHTRNIIANTYDEGAGAVPAVPDSTKVLAYTAAVNAGSCAALRQVACIDQYHQPEVDPGVVFLGHVEDRGVMKFETVGNKEIPFPVVAPDDLLFALDNEAVDTTYAAVAALIAACITVLKSHSGELFVEFQRGYRERKGAKSQRVGVMV